VLHPTALDGLTVSSADLARWGLLDQVERERCIDQLLEERPLPSPDRLLLLRQDLERRLQVHDPDALSEWLQRHGLQDADLDRMAARPWQWLMWCRERWGAELQTIFLRRKAEFDQVTYSLLRVLDAELASELYLQIKEGEVSFSEVASQFSCGPEKSSGGLLGPVALSQAHPALARLLQVSRPGQIWPPKALDGWWVVVRLEKLQPAGFDQAMQDRLLLDEGERDLRQRVGGLE